MWKNRLNKRMKRFGNLYEQIISIENLKLADKRARKGKSNRCDVKLFDKSKEDLLINLHHILLENNFNTSEYTIFKLRENNKEREIYKLPYYPDRIVHHAILNIIEPIFVKSFISQTYSCIKNRGIHKCLIKLKKDLKNKDTIYCLKLDIKKFYPNIDNSILKYQLYTKFKDEKLLNLLYNIVDSNKGLPIGNYCSQFLANFYLNKFDHWLKETKQIKYYYRYCDDIVILGNNKSELHNLRIQIQKYLYENLNLKLSNYQVFLIESRGIDFIGYRFYKNYILIRKRIKLKFIKMIKNNINQHSIHSYKGWLNWCNSYKLKNKYLNE